MCIREDGLINKLKKKVGGIEPRQRPYIIETMHSHALPM